MSTTQLGGTRSCREGARSSARPTGGFASLRTKWTSCWPGPHLDINASRSFSSRGLRPLLERGGCAAREWGADWPRAGCQGARANTPRIIVASGVQAVAPPPGSLYELLNMWLGVRAPRATHISSSVRNSIFFLLKSLLSFFLGACCGGAEDDEPVAWGAAAGCAFGAAPLAGAAAALASGFTGAAAPLPPRSVLPSPFAPPLALAVSAFGAERGDGFAAPRGDDFPPPLASSLPAGRSEGGLLFGAIDWDPPGKAHQPPTGSPPSAL